MPGELFVATKVITSVPTSFTEGWRDGLKKQTGRILERLQFTAPSSADYAANIAGPSADGYADVVTLATTRRGRTDAQVKALQRAKGAASFDNWNENISRVFTIPVGGTESEFETRVDAGVDPFARGLAEFVLPIQGGGNLALLGASMGKKVRFFTSGTSFAGGLSSILAGGDVLILAATVTLVTDPSSFAAAISQKIGKTFANLVAVIKNGGDLAAAIGVVNAELAPIATAFKVETTLTVEWEVASPSQPLGLRIKSVV